MYGALTALPIGNRREAQDIVVLITDGNSQDRIQIPGRVLRQTGADVSCKVSKTILNRGVARNCKRRGHDPQKPSKESGHFQSLSITCSFLLKAKLKGVGVVAECPLLNTHLTLREPAG